MELSHSAQFHWQTAFYWMLSCCSVDLDTVWEGLGMEKELLHKKMVEGIEPNQSGWDIMS
jgi:hypothetical protein